VAWPRAEGGAPRTLTARDILLSLLPEAHAGLCAAGVDDDERERFLGTFEARVRSGQTAAVWQRAVLARLRERGLDDQEALRTMLECYVRGFRSQRPVHAWSLEVDPDSGGAHV
jgi:hypothetical protein